MDTTKKERVLKELCRIFNEIKKDGVISVEDINEETPLYDGVICLDSLDTATLSVKLEEKFGQDPYTEVQNEGGEFPESVGDIIEFYQ